MARGGGDLEKARARGLASVKFGVGAFLPKGEEKRSTPALRGPGRKRRLRLVCVERSWHRHAGDGVP